MGYGLSRCKGVCIAIGQRDPNAVFCKNCNKSLDKDNCYIKAGLRCKCCGHRVRLKSTRNSGLK